MAETINRGPYASLGSLMDNTVGPFDGPGIEYQGGSIPDVRFGPARKDGLAPGRIPVFFNNPYFVLVDATPMTFSSTTVAASQGVSTGTAMTLNTTAAGGSAAGTPSFCAGIPIIPFGSTATTSAWALDFGFTTGTTTANSTTLPVPDSTVFQAGQWVIIGGAGNSSNTAGLITQVQTVLNATTITVSPAPLGALANAPIGNANLYGSGLLPPATQFGPAAPTANAANPYLNGGLSEILNPPEAVTRNLSVTGTASILITGWDIYGSVMTELITASAGTTVFGKKAFKYIKNAVPQNAGTCSIGIGDTFGFGVRSDKWEYANIFYNGAFATNSNGYSKAVTTSPATNTTGDVRGTIQVSTAGALGTSFFNAVTNGTTRLTLMMSVPVYNMINATPLNSVSMYGVTQSTT